jgi:hypothetical protein
MRGKTLDGHRLHIGDAVIIRVLNFVRQPWVLRGSGNDPASLLNASPRMVGYWLGRVVECRPERPHTFHWTSIRAVFNDPVLSNDADERLQYFDGREPPGIYHVFDPREQINLFPRLGRRWTHFKRQTLIL